MTELRPYGRVPVLVGSQDPWFRMKAELPLMRIPMALAALTLIVSACSPAPVAQVAMNRPAPSMQGATLAPLQGFAPQAAPAAPAHRRIP